MRIVKTFPSDQWLWLYQVKPQLLQVMIICIFGEIIPLRSGYLASKASASVVLFCGSSSPYTTPRYSISANLPVPMIFSSISLIQVFWRAVFPIDGMTAIGSLLSDNNKYQGRVGLSQKYESKPVK